MTFTDHHAAARNILAGNIYCTVATSSPDGEPWISPVFFAYDSDYAIHWVSNKDARHSRLIRANPRVAIAVFDSRAPEGAADAVYCTATVRELADPEELERAMLLMNARVTQDEFRVTDLAQVTGDGIWRVYRATSLGYSKLTAGDYVNGQYVDRRVDIGPRLDGR